MPLPNELNYVQGPGRSPDIIKCLRVAMSCALGNPRIQLIIYPQMGKKIYVLVLLGCSHDHD